MRKLFILTSVLTVTAMLMSGCSGKDEMAQNDQTNQEANINATVPYEIHSVEEDVNTSYGTKYGGQTYQVYVIVKEPANTEQLKAVCQAVANEVKKNNNKEVDAILVFPVDYPEYIGYGLPLGKAVLTSDGSWQWELKEKDWSKRLTPEEVKIWAAWQKLWKEKNAANPATLVDEKAVTAEIAKQFGIKPDKVEEIRSKQLMWSL